ncbi:leader peptidase (prepilin peptidase)/N-methyltransferase [Kibdelosporangium banguiense]|uniref:Leader peptidase (Prepilin peptidase)/N-methyltransferase n=1 Tax=Kibdelosporangium banguiense TaxID=1365924 RepID=A0ABS4U0M3_9PSEU|nr:A24 family peptidase [Kibdelosporangium banguiense]MBP2330190.1 leader peptidase (prepilin peptidase)/N-methyltransferase [Kibdelosporangium banguiense]
MAPTLLLTGLLAGSLGRLLLRRLSRGAEVRPGWCEAGCGVLWALLGLSVDKPTLWLPVMLALSWFAVLLTATDLLHNRLPDALTFAAYPVFALLIALSGTSALLRASVGAALFFCLHATVHYVAPHAMGGGDVKLSGSLGAILGAVSWPALVIALALAAVITLGLRAVSLSRWRDRVPHGPGLLAATWILAFLPGM